jgi:hypothetical protein
MSAAVFENWGFWVASTASKEDNLVCPNGCYLCKIFDGVVVHKFWPPHQFDLVLLVGAKAQRYC